MNNIVKFAGRIRTSKPEHYHHLRNVSVAYENGRIVANVTAFIREDKDGQLYAAFAECDERDQFNRQRGREVARRKWFQGKRTPVASRDFDEVFRAGEYVEEQPATQQSQPFCVGC